MWHTFVFYLDSLEKVTFTQHAVFEFPQEMLSSVNTSSDSWLYSSFFMREHNLHVQKQRSERQDSGSSSCELLLNRSKDKLSHLL